MTCVGGGASGRGELQVNGPLTRTIIVKNLCDKHRQGFSWWIDAFTMRRQMSLDCVEEAIIGDQIEYPD